MPNAQDSKAQEILKLLKYMKRIRDPFDTLCQDIADHIAPLRQDYNQQGDQGQRQDTYIYNANPVYAVQVYVEGHTGQMIPSNIPWLKLTLKVPVNELIQKFHPGALTRGPMRPYIARYEYLEDVPELRGWLQHAAGGVLREYENSNFYSEMPPFFEDGGTMGTATQYSEWHKDDNRIVYDTMHPGKIWIAENMYGEVDTVFREDKLEAKKLMEKFDKEKLSNEIRNAAQNEPYKTFPVLHAVFPRTDRDPRKQDGLNKPWASYWIDKTKATILREWGYDMLPYQVWRPYKAGTETYGRSEAMKALAAIISLNLLSKDQIRASELAVDPAYNAPAELRGEIDITPHGFTYYGEDEKRIVRPVQTGIDYPIGKDREEAIQDVIDKFFHVDYFMMLQRATRQMTAYEVMQRRGEKAILLTGSTNRLTREGVSPNVTRTFYFAYRAGHIMEIPEMYWNYGAAKLGIAYLGPMAQDQRRLFKTAGITQGLAATIPYADVFGPQALDRINVDETIKYILDSYDYPQQCVNTDDQVKAIRDRRAQLEAAEAQKRDMLESLEGVKTLAQADQASGGQIMEGMKQQLLGPPEGTA